MPENSEVSISPTPSDEETAAIAAALHTTFNGQATVGDSESSNAALNWRFRGRWWSDAKAWRQAGRRRLG